MKIIESKLPGVVEIVFNKLNDNRGSFTKTYHQEIFRSLGIDFEMKEEYFTASTKGVFRGLHFQNPPMELHKLVYCVSGRVNDYIVDLRVGSPTYGHYVMFELDGEKPSAVFAPIGMAHGFYVKSEHAVMQYKVSQVYDAASDAGVLYTSFEFANDIVNPIISNRDLNFSSLADFKSAFTYSK